MNIVIAASECVPFAKTGGLADVAGALPKAMAENGDSVVVVIPGYISIDREEFSFRKMKFKKIIQIGEESREATFEEGYIPDSQVPVYLVNQPYYFTRPELYGEGGKDYVDNDERYIFFCKAVLELLKSLKFRPDVLHCNDWQTGLIPTFLKYHYSDDVFYKKTKTAFSIHNLAYQGLFPIQTIQKAGLGWEHATMDRLEYWSKICFLKAGLIDSDLLLTVSERYAEEIQTPEYGCGMEGILSARKNDLHGVLNGLDYNVWNPAADRKLSAKFSIRDISGKDANKKALLQQRGIPYKKNAPLIAIITRLDRQKGLDILAEVIEDIVVKNVQFVLLGTGAPEYHRLFEKLMLKYPDKISAYLRFDSILAHQIYAGSDYFLMPSRYEPCGLGQLISLRYGTIPIVRATGGLADTIIDVDQDPLNGNGFVFDKYSGKELLDTINRAMELYKNKAKLNVIRKRAMNADFSWRNSAKKYHKLFHELVKRA